jgi:hypothetical protein
MRNLALLLVLAAGPALAQSYANVDSIVVHGLVYIGATDRAEYAYDDTVHVLYRVANRSAETESLWVRWHCTPSLTQETWCDTLGACEESPEMLRDCTANDPPVATLELVPPGERVLASYSIPTRFVIGSTLRFQVAEAHFFDPWDTAPYFHFAIPYVRRPIATAVETRTWTQVRALYRNGFQRN